jgi:homoserine dehydrogenase
MKTLIKIGIIGYGNVGQGVAKVIENNKKGISERIGVPIEIAGICDIRPAPAEYKDIYTKRYHDLLENPDIDIIVELIGGYEPARTIIMESLKAGKHVVTANKAVLAKYWGEVFTEATRRKKLIYFEASVGGGIPVIQALNEGLAANRIEKIIGILNGTTNFILSEMTRNKLDYSKALARAQKSGFAEADPAFDVDGTDTAHKLAVLSSLAWSSWVKLENIKTTGITRISDEDVRAAHEEFGRVIKLLGYGEMKDGRLALSVEPCLISEKNTFANVEKEYNAISITGDSVGDVMLYGKGAGQLAAASAVVSDIMYLARQVAHGTAGILPDVTYNPRNKVKFLAADKIESCYYLRFTVADQPGVLAKIASILGRHHVSIASVYQREGSQTARKKVSVVMLSHIAMAGNVAKAIKEIDKQKFTKAQSMKLRVID